MGILDQIGSLAGQLGQNNASQAGVAGALMQALEQHPGGVAGVLDSLRQNGLGQHVDTWANGQPAAVSPDQVQQGLNGTNIVEKTAEQAGISHDAAAAAIAAVMPMVIQHFAPNGQPTTQSEFCGLAEQFLAKVL